MIDHQSMKCVLMIFRIIVFLQYFVHASQTADPCNDRFQLDFYPLKNAGRCTLEPLTVVNVVSRNQCFSVCIYNQHCWLLTLKKIRESFICSVFNNTCAGKFEADPKTTAFEVKVAYCNKKQLLTTTPQPSPSTTTQLSPATPPTSPQPAQPLVNINIPAYCSKKLSDEWKCMHSGITYGCNMVMRRFNEPVQFYNHFNAEKEINGAEEYSDCKQKLYWAGNVKIHDATKGKEHDLVFQFYEFTDATKQTGVLILEKMYCGFQLFKFVKFSIYYAAVKDELCNSSLINWDSFVKSLANLPCQPCQGWENENFYTKKVYENIYCKWGNDFESACLKWDFFMLVVRERYNESECPGD